MYCPKCGCEIDYKTKYCRKCGAKLPYNMEFDKNSDSKSNNSKPGIVSHPASTKIFLFSVKRRKKENTMGTLCPSLPFK